MKRPLLIALCLVLLSSCSESSSESPDAALPAVDAAAKTETISVQGTVAMTNLPVHDVWGYLDSASGKEYALVCASTSGLRIVDTSDRGKPVEVGSVSGSEVQATDVKVWKHYAYTVGEGAGVTGSIIDLAIPSSPQKVGTFPVAHNIYISEAGYLYAAGPGLTIYDLRGDPLMPQRVYRDRDCKGHDVAVIGDRLFDFADDCGTRIFNVSNPASPQLLGTVVDRAFFHHSGWPSEDGNFLFLTDEIASPSEPDIAVWDIRDLSNPKRVASYRDADSYIHNLYVVGRYAYVSYYRAGFRVFDVSDPANLVLVDEYDTDPTMSGPGYGGNFGVYACPSDGAIYASDENRGLFVFAFDGDGL